MGKDVLTGHVKTGVAYCLMRYFVLDVMNTIYTHSIHHEQLADCIKSDSEGGAKKCIQKADLIFYVPFSLDLMRTYNVGVIEFSTPVGYRSTCLISKKSPPVSPFALYKPFQTTVWTLLATSTLAMLLVSRLPVVTSDGGLLRQSWLSILNIIMILLLQGVDFKLRTVVNGKVVAAIGVWILLLSVLQMAYSGVLSAMIIAPGKGNNIDSIDDLIHHLQDNPDGGWGVSDILLFYQAWARNYSMSARVEKLMHVSNVTVADIEDITLLKGVPERYKELDVREKRLRVIPGYKLDFKAVEMIIEQGAVCFLPCSFLDRNRNLHESNEHFDDYKGGLGFPLGFHREKDYNDRIQRLQQGDLIAEDLKRCKYEDNPVRFDSFRVDKYILSLEKLRSYFYVLVAGITAAALVFLLELVVYRIVPKPVKDITEIIILFPTLTGLSAVSIEHQHQSSLEPHSTASSAVTTATSSSDVKGNTSPDAVEMTSANVTEMTILEITNITDMNYDITE